MKVKYIGTTEDQDRIVDLPDEQSAPAQQIDVEQEVGVNPAFTLLVVLLLLGTGFMLGWFAHG